MSRKIDPNRMSPQELENYVNDLPENAPPKMSSAVWLGIFAVIALIAGFYRLNQGYSDIATWGIIIGGVAFLVGAGYLVYRVLHFNSHP